MQRMLLGLALLTSLAACGCGKDSTAQTETGSRELPLLSIGSDSAIPLTERDGLLINSLEMEFIKVPAGEFLMGSADWRYLGDRAAGERPIHLVRINREFGMGRHEVTVGQFRRFVEDTGYRTEAERDGQGSNSLDLATGEISQRPDRLWNSPGFPQTDNHPVTCVSAADALAFCDWLTRGEGHRYRLPTEAEWEYACRGGTETRYYTGDEPDSLEGAANLADQAFHRSFPLAQWTVAWSDSHSQTAPVGSFRPNPFGLHDMLGNVGEWCSDWYSLSYYGDSPADDPQGPDGPLGYRVVRGGSWYNSPESARSAGRHDGIPTMRSTTNGFRVVIELPQPADD